MKPTFIEGKTINDAVLKALEELIYNGYRTKSRNGDINTIYNFFSTIENPKARHLSLNGRKNNIFASIAETFWVFAGSNGIDPYLSFFLPRAKDFSDDGKNWRGGYPERIKNGNQLDDVIEQFRNEGIYTRRATLYIGDPNLDTKESLENVYGLDKTLDKPCFLSHTEILTNSGYKRISEVTTEDLVYSYNESSECVELKRVEWSGKTKDVSRYLKITLSNGDEVCVTEDHSMYMKEYSFVGRSRQPYTVIQKKASEIEIGDYILSTPIHENGGLIKKNLRENKRFSNLTSWHRDSFEYFYGEIPEGMTVHHKNGDHFDNSKENLELLTESEHNRIHKLLNNPSRNKKVIEKKVEANRQNPGYSHGLMFKGLSKEEILDIFEKRIEELETLSYDYANKNLGTMGFPSLTRIVDKFGSWKNFKHQLKNRIGDHKVFERRIKENSDTSMGFIKVIGVEYVEESVGVFDITVEDNHNFILKSGGWIVHNCNMAMDFFVTPDKRLHMNVKSRSGDVIWGWGSINIFEWTFLQEMILQSIQDEIDPEVSLGSYNHHVTNLHLYDFNGAQGYQVLENKLHQKIGLNADDEIVFPDLDDTHDFFKELVDFYSELIISEGIPSYGKNIKGVNNIFKKYHVPVGSNLLYEYASLVLAYICQKKSKLSEVDFNLTIPISGSDEFIYSIEQSSFRKFNIEVE